MTQPNANANTNNNTPGQPLLVLLDNKEAQESLLNSAYPQLAAYAFTDYRKTGKRSAVVPNELEINQFLAGQDSLLKANGIEAGIDALDALALPGIILPDELLLGLLRETGYATAIVDEVASSLSSYQPEKEIVVIVIHGSDDLTLYQLSPKPGQPAPPLAAKLASSNLN